MCGIAGVVTRSGGTDWIPAVQRAVKTLAHRGPDDEGVVEVRPPTGAGDGAPRAVLGNVRLAILDLSPSGHMPMASADGRVWITYNGELYNFRELRGVLESRGHAFVSRGDTEVVLHAYLEWGEAFLNRLNGMFALAVVDRRPERGLRCLVARDQLGIKPCYYADRGGTLAFASEIKGLMALGVVPDELDWQALWDYFSFLYIPGPATAYAAVRQLPPAHYLVWDVEHGAPSIRRYWTPVADGTARTEGGGNSVAEVRDLLRDAVHRQLISDVPIGVFLSGGIDSTIVAALAAEAVPARLKTFTVLFEGEGIGAVDDRDFARRVAARYLTDHTELVVNVSDPNRILEIGLLFDQPFGNPTFYLSYLISSLTRRHVTVALSGAGGDELFGGYPRYRALPYARLLSGMPAVLGRGLQALAQRALREDADRALPRRLKLLLRGIGHRLPEQYLRWTYYFADEEKERLLLADVHRDRRFAPSARHIASRLAIVGDGADLGTRIQYVDLETFLADNILEYTDRTSMAVSLEVRVPFLDPRLVEWSFRLPYHEKLAGGTAKRILRAAFGDLIPAENLAAPKRGFCPPLATWMAGPLDRYFNDGLDAASVRRQGIFDWDAIQSLRAAHRQRRRDTSMELFGVIMFDIWWKRHVGGAP